MIRGQYGLPPEEKFDAANWNAAKAKREGLVFAFCSLCSVNYRRKFNAVGPGISCAHGWFVGASGASAFGWTRLFANK